MVTMDAHCDAALAHPWVAGPSEVGSGAILESLPRTDVCEQPHSPATALRWLCGSRALSVSEHASAVLGVSVSLCASDDQASDPSALVVVIGELSANTIDEAVSAALDAYVQFVRNVVIDCSRLVAIDHRGAVMLNELDLVASRAGGTLAVHEPPALVEHVIRFCGLSDRVRICAEG